MEFCYKLNHKCMSHMYIEIDDAVGAVMTRVLVMLLPAGGVLPGLAKARDGDGFLLVRWRTWGGVSTAFPRTRQNVIVEGCYFVRKVNMQVLNGN